MNAVGTWSMLLRSRLSRRRYLRQVLREARQQVVFGPAGRITAVIAATGYAVALVPFGLVLLYARAPLPLLGGALVTAQLLALQAVAGLSPRLVRNTRRLSEVLATGLVVLVAATPAGELIHGLWRDHPFLWRQAGIGLLAALAGLVVVRLLLSQAAGLGRLMTIPLFTVLATVIGYLARVLVGHGELAVLLVAVFRPDAELVVAAVVLAGAQFALLGYRFALRSTRFERFSDAFAVSRLDPALRRRELSGWIYDSLITHNGQQDISLPRVLAGIARSLAPEVLRDPGERPYLASGATDVQRSRLLLDMAVEAADLVERVALPNVVGLRRQTLERQLAIVRAGICEVESRLALAGGDVETAVARLGDYADGLAAEGLPNLALHTRTVRAHVAYRFDLDPPDDLGEFVSDESLSLAVRVPALRMIAINRVREADLDGARLAWRTAQQVVVPSADYRSVARETRAEAGAMPVDRLRQRRHAKARLGERIFAVRLEDTLVNELVR